jgi:hypothetical protein
MDALAHDGLPRNNFQTTSGGTAGNLKGTGELYVNGMKVAEPAIDQTVPSAFSLSESFDVGVDNGTPVSNNYETKDHFPFTGELDKVIITLKQEPTAPPHCSLGCRFKTPESVNDLTISIV